MRRLAAGAATLVVTASTASLAAAQQLPVDEQPLQIAGRAAERVSFLGVVQVRWFEGTSERRETMLVQGANGAVVVRGGSAVMADKNQRLVEHQGGDWDLLWPVSRTGLSRPDLRDKYELAWASGPTVGGRPSRLVEVNRAGALVERLYLDRDTDLLLRREQFEGGGPSPRRTVGFEVITIGGATPEPPKPNSFANVAARAVPAGRLSKRVTAPLELADGYRRLGVFRRSDVVQVLYSDGLYDLSLFQQQGWLDRAGLPRGERVTVRGASGWRYTWPGGHVVLWQTGGTVYTAVSDAPLEQVLGAVRSLPPAQEAAPLLWRLRQVCRALLQPLSG